MYVSTKFKLLGSLFIAVACYGDTINLVGSAAALGANDSILWGQLGADGVTIGHTFNLTSTGGASASGSYAGTTGLVAIGCPSAPQCSWGPIIGIGGGDGLNWAFDPNGNGGNGVGTGALTVNLPTGFGAGAIISADLPVGTSFTANLQLFNGLISLGSVSSSSNGNGDAFFIGAFDATGANVTKAVFSLSAISGGGDLGDFAVDTVSLNSLPVLNGVPEPASAFLLGSALLAVGWKLKRRV